MLSNFIKNHLMKVTYKLLKDKSYFGEIAGLEGVWANALNLEECRNELREVLESWIVLKLQHGESIPGFSTQRPKAVSPNTASLPYAKARVLA